MRHLILLLLFALPVKAEVVAMTTNFAAVQPAIQASELSGELAARSGGLHYHRNGNSAIIVVDSLNGLEGLAALADEVTSYEEIFGYRVQRVVDGEPQWTTEIVQDPTPIVWTENWEQTGPIDPMTGEAGWEDNGSFGPEQDCTYNAVEVPDPNDPENTIIEQQLVGCVDYVPEPREVKTPVYDEVPRVPGLLELYQTIYPYNVPDEDGNTRSRFTVTFGADSVKDILNPEVPQ